MNFRPLLFIPPVALGVAGFMWMTTPREVPSEPVPEMALAVRVQTVAPRQHTVAANGYGRVTAAHSWSAVSEVQGRVTHLAEGLAEGTIVEAGQVLIEIDRTDYELSRQKALANIAAAEAGLAELDRSEANSRRALEYEQSILTVAQNEYERVQSLVGRGTSTEATLDSARKTLLAQEAKVTSLTNTLALFPAQRASAEAALAVRRAELAEAERALQKTTLTAPFRGRATAVTIDEGQFVRSGDSLITLDNTDTAEITAEIQPSAFQPMITSAFGGKASVQALVDTARAVEIFAQAGITAQVQLANGMPGASWPAQIVRVRGTQDAQTGALGIVVRVDDPLLAAPQLGRPPLNSGAFVSVIFSTTPEAPMLTIPRDALHLDDDGTRFVYLADADDRLARRTVTTGPVIGAEIVIREGLSTGDRLVLGDPRPPIPGMKLDPVDVTARGQ